MISPASFRIDPASWEADRSELQCIREQVFIVEQGVPGDDEWDALDARARHVLARDATGRAIGTGRLTVEHAIGRMAVLREWRGKGVGTAILRVLLEQARELRYPAIELHAQSHALAFYEKFGFSAVGEDFPECGMPHRLMRLELALPDPPPPAALAAMPAARILQTDDRTGALAATLDLLADARYEAAIFSRDLDPALFDTPSALDALKRIALSSRNARVRVIVQEPRMPVANGHRLIALARRLPSLMQLRTPLQEKDLALPSAWLLNDRGGYLYRPLGSGFEGEGSTCAPGRHGQLLDTFNQVWERSATDVELRALEL